MKGCHRSNGPTCKPELARILGCLYGVKGFWSSSFFDTTKIHIILAMIALIEPKSFENMAKEADATRKT
ncbi:hypothetical protein Syun_002173 [Stephania yunnanensis]|uniref:Uncharacterized protein n=1 Tax=Stephania yunnanensis TaxID=152371 RepID=A0AAP0Q7T1_9MAGN